jgi:hypothetical protein
LRKIKEGIKVNTFFKEFLLKNNVAYSLYQVKLTLTKKTNFKDFSKDMMAYTGNNPCEFMKDFI